MKSGKIGAIIAGIIIIFLLILGFSCAERVPAGYVGVVYDMSGGIEDNTLSQGWHLVAPTKNVTLYSIGIEQSYLTKKKTGDSKDDDSFEVPSKDGKGLKVDITFTYRYDADKVPNTFTRFKGRSGKEILTTFIKPNIISWTKEVTAKYYVTELLADKRAEINAELSDYLKKKFDSYGIIIESASVIDISADESTQQAIQKKISAQQDYETAQIKKKTAEVNAEKNKSVAEINAEKAKAEAQGKADAIKIEADAQAAANKEIAKSLTPELIEHEKYQKWDGKLPTVQGSSTPIITMSEETEG